MTPLVPACEGFASHTHVTEVLPARTVAVSDAPGAARGRCCSGRCVREGRWVVGLCCARRGRWDEHRRFEGDVWLGRINRVKGHVSGDRYRAIAGEPWGRHGGWSRAGRGDQVAVIAVADDDRRWVIAVARSRRQAGVEEADQRQRREHNQDAGSQVSAARSFSSNAVHLPCQPARKSNACRPLAGPTIRLQSTTLERTASEGRPAQIARANWPAGCRRGSWRRAVSAQRSRNSWTAACTSSVYRLGA